LDLLLDTQIFFWIATETERVPRRARQLIEEASRVYVSAATIWELTIKIGLGKLRGDPLRLADAIAESDFLELPITARHGAAVRRLVSHHKDPFDRLLVTQAVEEGLDLLTSDELLALYSDRVIVV
jgi:PIN domain nuclease of toxin-antitoxin system